MHLATKSAAERFFRSYYQHCTAPNSDTLFNLLNAGHSLNDKMKKESGQDFFSVHEFITLKAFRNLFHHQAELISYVRAIPFERIGSIHSDLAYLCLLPRKLAEEAINTLEKKRRLTDEPIIRNTLKWYPSCINLNPCIFNFAVHAFEKSRSLELELDCDGYLMLEESYSFETEHGYSHFVTGDIYTQTADVGYLIDEIFRTSPN